MRLRLSVGSHTKSLLEKKIFIKAEVLEVGERDAKAINRGRRQAQ